MELPIILLGVLLLVLVGGGRHLLGCAWHLFAGAALLVIVVVVILILFVHRGGYA